MAYNDNSIVPSIRIGSVEFNSLNETSGNGRGQAIGLGVRLARIYHRKS